MGYDLNPRNKKIDEISIGAFTWPVILKETGAGHIVGYGEGVEPATYVYAPRKQASPVSNDGYRVTAKEAEAMAMCAYGFLSVAKFIQKTWDSYSEGEKQQRTDAKSLNGRSLFRQPYNETFLIIVEKFAEFATKSKGFSIH